MCNFKPACFSTDRDFFSVFTSRSSDLTLKEKSWFIIKGFSKTIKLFIWHHFQTRKFNRSAAEVQDISAVCLPFISGNIFLPMADDQMMFPFVVSKVQKEQGILLFVHWKLAWESYVLGAFWGFLFEILVARGWIVGASGNQAPVRQQPC